MVRVRPRHLSRSTSLVASTKFLVYAYENFGLPTKINGMKDLILKVCLITLFAFTVTAHAQQPSPVAPSVQTAVKTFQLDSKLMKRQMPYGVFLPVNYETDKQARFPVVYLLHGLSGSYKTFSDNRERLEDYPKRRIIFVLVEGGTSWFTDSATVPNDKYESYIIQELIPEIDKNFRTIAERKGRAVGWSFDGRLRRVKIWNQISANVCSRGFVERGRKCRVLAKDERTSAASARRAGDNGGFRRRH